MSSIASTIASFPLTTTMADASGLKLVGATTSILLEVLQVYILYMRARPTAGS